MLSILLCAVTGIGAQVQAPPTRGGKTSVTVRVIVLNYDPVLKSQGNKTLREYMKWEDPHQMTPNLVKYLGESSGSYAKYQIVDFIDVNAFPEKRDGFNYNEKTFLEMWNNRDLAHQPDAVSYAAIFRNHNLSRRIQQENIQEIWLWGAPYFGWDEYAMKLPNDEIFYPTDNPWFYRPYDIPAQRKTVWVMGFNYERGEAEAIHSFGHRCEGILSLTVGKGIWDHKKTPNNIWNHFTKQAKDFPNDAQVGNVHGGPNAKDGYDYGQMEKVLSAADDWLNYPRLTGKKTWINADSWGGPNHHLNFMRWWLRHLPQAAGQTDGFHNNWWEYVVNYDDAVKKLPPPGGKLRKANNAMW